MNKKERSCDVDNIVEWRHIITALLALVAMAGQGQIRYRLEGTIGDSTLNTRLLLNQGMSAMKMVNATIDTLEVVNGKLIPKEGTLEEPGSFDLRSVTENGGKPDIQSPVFIIEEGTMHIHLNPKAEENKAPDTPPTGLSPISWVPFIHCCMAIQSDSSASTV